MRSKTLFVASLIAAATLTSPAMADKAILVLDASGSMWGQIDGKPKIEIAQKVVAGLVSDWATEVELGVIAYGHREKASCTDIETLVPVGAVDAGAINASIGGLNPKGKTPITEAVRLAAQELRSTEEKATVILLSDGLETCDADPCAAATELEAAGIDFTVHVVGFGTDEEENRQLQCIADNTGGQFLGAADASTLQQAMATVKENVARNLELRPVPVAASADKVVFLDSFDGDALEKHWTIQNENLDGYLLENGGLFLLTAESGGFSKDDAKNLLTLPDVEMDGDWDIAVDIYPHFPTGADRFEIGMRASADAHVRAFLWTDGTGDCRRMGLTVHRKGGEEANHDLTIWGTRACSWSGSEGGMDPEQVTERLSRLRETGGTLTLSKRGRSYSASFASSLMSAPVQTDELTILRPSGSPALNLSQSDGVDGETSVIVDEVRISKVE